MFSTSLSAIGLWQRCRKAYDYKYVQRLTRPQAAYPVTLGRMVHEYLAGYYRTAQQMPAEISYAVHLHEVECVNERYAGELNAFANACFVTGDEELAKEYFALPQVFASLADRYYRARGYDDWRRYRVVHVEESLRSKLTVNIQQHGVVDLVTEDRDTGEMQVWEHKSTKTVPPPGIRLQDMQTLVYVAQLKQQYGYDLRSVLWNYLRTVPPAEPRILKDGSVSMDKRVDTTWELYAMAVHRSGWDPDSERFAEIHERLQDRELTVFFPRFEQVLVSDPSMLLNEYITNAKLVKRDVNDWKHGYSIPTRTLDRHCTWCDFASLCQAAITGGDEEDIVRLKFQRKETSQ